MPFTLSHMAAALPLRRLKLVWSAFVVGSVAPDFPYIIGTIEYRNLGHQFPGVVEFTLPLSLFALWLFHIAVKRTAATLLPAGVRQRLCGQLGDFKFGGPVRFAVILFSIVLGIAIHLIWDAFTHSFTWIWWRWSWLQRWVIFPIAGPIPMYETLQYASTVIGLIALGVWFLFWYHNTPPTQTVDPASARSGSRIAVAMISVAVVIGLIRAWLVIGIPRNLDMADSFLLVFGVTALALVFWEVLTYCVMISSHQTWLIS